MRVWEAFIGILITLTALITSASAQPIYTGLIIDARGLGIQTGMSPKIYDADERVVYGNFEYIDPNYVINEGIVKYAESTEVAEELELSGNHPMVVKAIAMGEDPSGASVVIKDQDAWKIRVANDLKDFLSRHQVTIIL